MAKVSIVVALYNQQKLVLRLVESLKAQTLEDFEAVIVDDASTDHSAAFIQQVCAEDSRFRLIRLTENGGAGRARNAGIMAATGETLCFADPDDLLPENSLEVRYMAYKKHNAIVRACHVEVDSRGNVLNQETRPENLPEVSVPSRDAARIGVNPFLSAHWAWLFPTRLLQRQQILNEEGTRTAEDIMFLVRLFFSISRLVWIPDLAYYWVKQKDSLSTTAYTAQHYIEYFPCVELFYSKAAEAGKIELGDLFCNEYLVGYLSHLSGQVAKGVSTEVDAQAVVNFIKDTCGDHGTFMRLESGKISRAQSMGIRWLDAVLRNPAPGRAQKLLESYGFVLKETAALRYERIRKLGWEREVRFDSFDRHRSLVRGRYLFFKEHPEELCTFNAQPQNIAFSKNRLVHEAGDEDIRERILWLPVPEDADAVFSLTVGDKTVSFPAAQIYGHFRPKPPEASRLSAEDKALRKLAQSETVRSRYAGAWMFIDRDTQADDNAEHLYRWVMNNRPGINSFFVLREDSPDWDRLKREGFKLIPFDDIEHKLLFILADFLISSQMDKYIYEFLDPELFGDLRDCRFVALQHGVINHDLSRWLNTINPIDLFVTTTRDEYHSIVDDGTGYNLTGKEVIRTGLPRHDRLVLAKDGEKRIFVMPSWRFNIAGRRDGGQQKELNRSFSETLFAKIWREFLSSRELRELAAYYGHGVVFWPHPTLLFYLEDFGLPEYIRKPSADETIQSLLMRSNMLITDFSSIAFDMGVMGRAVLYYQFESFESFLEAQNRQTSYFDPNLHGFGPVCSNQAELFKNIESLLEKNCKPQLEYVERMRTTFDLGGSSCCRQVIASIESIYPHARTV